MLEEMVAETIARCERNSERDSYPRDWPVMPPIPAARYTDPRLYELEMKHMWMKTWLLAGHVSELAEQGDYKLFKHLGQNVILSHGPDGQVRAFHNICRHRSSPLLLEEKGRAKRFLCPYHSWGFAATGELQTVPEQHNFPCLDKASLSMLPVHSHVWRGFIFISFAEEPIAFDEFMGPVAGRLEGFPFEEMEVKRFTRFEMDANWKAVVDNFNESYHLNTVHPSIARWIRSQTFVVEPLRNGHAYQTTLRNNRSRYASERPSPPGSYPLFEEVIVNMPIFPNISGGLDLSGFVWETFWPAGPDRMIMDVHLFGWKGNVDEEHWDRAFKENLHFAGEDMRLLPSVYAAMRSGNVKEIHVGYQEMDIYWYHEEIDRLIGSGNVPEELRIQRVLGPYAQG